MSCKNRSSRKRNQFPRRQKQTKHVQVSKLVTEGRTVRIPRSINGVPDCIEVWMRYTNPIETFVNAGALFSSSRWRMNSVFDIDPRTGGGVVEYWTFYATAYSAYRVVGFRYRITATNMDSFAKKMVVWPSNSDLGANYASTDLAADEPNAKSTLLDRGVGGKDQKVISGVIDPLAMYGSLSVDNFAASYNSNPTVIIYLNSGFSSANVEVTGCTMTHEFWIKTQWFKKNVVNSFKRGVLSDRAEVALDILRGGKGQTVAEIHKESADLQLQQEKARIIELFPVLSNFKMT